MLRSAFLIRFDRLFGISARERTRRSRGFASEYARRPERLEDRALLATVMVHVSNNSFSPSTLTVQPGDTVRWVFDQGVHDTTSVAGISESWNSGVKTTPGATFEHTFDDAGSFAYYCSIHGFDQGNGTAAGMAGRIIVKASVPLRSIRVTPVRSVINAGSTQQYAAIGVFTDNSTQDLTGHVTWATGTPSVATITHGGRATGAARGNTAVIARLGNIAGQAVLTVLNAPAPTLTGVQRVTARVGRKTKVVGFELSFSGPLNGAVAQFTGHYQVTQPGQGRRPQPKPVAVLGAQYNAARRSITLTLGAFKANKPLSLTATGLIGATGTPVARIVTPL